MTYSVLICEDHKIVTDGVLRILENSGRYAPAGACSTAGELMLFLQEQVPDILILDLNLPDRSGLECLPQIRSSHPDLSILILTMHRDALLVKKVRELGADGFLLKDFGEDEMLIALDKLVQGEQVFPVDIAENGAAQLSSKALFLTGREKEIVRLTAQGLSTPEIAEQLYLSPHTVNTHRRNIYKKLNVANIKELVAFVHENGLA